MGVRFIFIVHRARLEIFRKKAFVISTTVGAGTKNAIKTVSDSLKFWGVNRVYSYSFATFGEEWDSMKAERKEKIISKIKKKAAGFYKEVASGKIHRPYMLIRIMFFAARMLMRKLDDADSLDKKYWVEKGWLSGKNSPFKA